MEISEKKNTNIWDEYVQRMAVKTAIVTSDENYEDIGEEYIVVGERVSTKR